MTDRRAPRVGVAPRGSCAERRSPACATSRPARPSDVVPTLVLPPQAGHDSCIVDFSAEQSQMQTIRAAGLERLYSLDWIGATQDDEGRDDRRLPRRSSTPPSSAIGGPVNLVGDCQGGWLATIYAALHPEHVNTLTIAGAPIDFHAGDAGHPRCVQALADETCASTGLVAPRAAAS